jgi:hypothetical protein
VAVEQKLIVKQLDPANSSDKMTAHGPIKPQVEVQLTLQRLSKIVRILRPIFRAFDPFSPPGVRFRQNV